MLSHIWLGMAYMAQGDLEAAIASYDKAISLEGDSPLALGYLGFTLVLADRRAEAESVLKRFDKLSDGYVHPYCKALIHIGLGDHNQAFDLIDKAFTERDPLLIYLPCLPQLIPSLEQFAADPRFMPILQKMDIRD